MKRLLRRIGVGVIGHAPAPLAYRLRLLAERAAFLLGGSSGELPPVFHYWSHNYLYRKFHALGFHSPQHFYFRHLAERAQASGEPVRCLSLAAGRCDMELEVMRMLVADGIHNVHLTCNDLNAALLKIGQRAVAAAGLEGYFSFERGDLNQSLGAGRRHDVVMANQCLHHFVELEAIFDAIHASLGETGEFLTADVIGRNGHQLWPEALAEVERFWAELPPAYRQDRTRGRLATDYVNFDHSNVGFEGIRAQDVLPLLLERFHVGDFIAFGCITLPFVERRFGWNFDPDRAFDREFIDRVATRDEALIADGTIKPTQLVASFHTRPVPLRSAGGLDPAACVRPVDA